MCKLNIFCKEADGECGCIQRNSKAVKTVHYSGLLCSILTYIKEQPEIMKSLSESNHIPIENVISVMPVIDTTLDLKESPTTQECSQEGITDLSIYLLCDVPSKWTVGRGISIMAEIVDKDFGKNKMIIPVIFQACLIDKDTGEDKLLLGEVETNGVAFFRKLIVNQEIDNVCLAVRVKERNDIAQFVKDIKLKPRKKRDMAVKKTKSLDLEIEV